MTKFMVDPTNPLYLIMAAISLLAIFTFMVEYRKCETDMDKHRLGLSAVWATVSIVFIFGIVDVWEALEIGKAVANYQLTIIIVFMIGYILISSTVVSFAAYEKKGFHNLERYNQDRWHMVGIVTLVLDLALGLLFGLASSVIAGLGLGVICLVFNEPHYGLIYGLIYGAAIGIPAALIYESFIGLTNEFARQTT